MKHMELISQNMERTQNDGVGKRRAENNVRD
jgi:hypothetical protein